MGRTRNRSAGGVGVLVAEQTAGLNLAKAQAGGCGFEVAKRSQAEAR